ncbi:hypothetical protein K445DRAFT_22635 [Daldinia sp. EC12]|nr:hypothetical protein K445DRAFT_22635 [Daldinia sp. EC12]
MPETQAPILPLCSSFGRARVNQLPPIPSNLVIEPGKFSILASFPAELHLHTLSFLSLKDIIHLRRLCRHYYYYFTRDRIRRQFSNRDGEPDLELLQCCVECLRIFEQPLVLDDERWQSPWRSMCYRCFRVERSPAYHRDPSKSPAIRFTDGTNGRVCSWCGWPEHNLRGHASCFSESRNATELIQLMIGVSAYHAFALIPMLTLTVWRPNIFIIYAASLCEIYVCVRCYMSLNEQFYPNGTAFRYPHKLMGPALVLLWLPAVIQGALEMRANLRRDEDMGLAGVVLLYYGFRL